MVLKDPEQKTKYRCLYLHSVTSPKENPSPVPLHSPGLGKSFDSWILAAEVPVCSQYCLITQGTTEQHVAVAFLAPA